VDELLKRGSGEPKIKEVVVEEAKSMVTPSLANEDHNNTIEEQDDDHSSEKSSASSFEVSPEHVEFQHRLLVLFVFHIIEDITQYRKLFR
jgi:hypothetical protein